MNRETLLKIFSSYWGSPAIEIGQDSENYHIAKIDSEYLDRMENVDTISKLLLTPLSKISDADAIEVSKMCGYDEKYAILYIKEDCSTKSTLWKNWGIEAFDFLRSKSYDIGYGNIPSLIEAGIALENIKHGEL